MPSLPAPSRSAPKVDVDNNGMKLTSLRPIAPARPPTPVMYSGSCNPPRRAKRARTASVSQSYALSPSSELSPSPSPSPSPTPPPSSTRRGRKPSGTLTRAARESLRKQNHSKIEKKRREKINEALDALRHLVPADVGDVESEAKKTKGKEKEFKLEVLIRTVDYMKELIERVQVLEKGCDKCSGDTYSTAASSDGPSTGEKRKRPDEDDEAEDTEEEADVDVDASEDELMEDEPAREDDSEVTNIVSGEAPLTPTSPALPPTSAPPSPPSPSSPSFTVGRTLPPISQWLPHPYVDPSYIRLALSPSSLSSLPSLPSPSLLTPPNSTKLVPGSDSPSADADTVPRLDMPSPHLLPVELKSLSVGSSTRGRRGRYSPEDETAASMLLQISASSSVSSNISIGDQTDDIQRPLVPQTPSSLMGVRTRVTSPFGSNSSHF